MIQDKLKREAEFRRFLLCEMSEDERSALEREFVTDEDLFEQIRVVEDELIESYVLDALAVDEKEKFERSFLTTKRRRERVDFTRAMLDKLAQQKEISAAAVTETTPAKLSVWDSIAEFFKTPKLAFGAAFALLILIFGGWFLLRNPNQTEIARQITPTPTVQITQTNQNRNLPANQNEPVNSNTIIPEKNPENKNVLQNVNRETPNGNQNSNTQKQPSSGLAPVLALFSGTVRSNGKMSELNLPKNVSGATLQLNLESNIYKIYMVEIVDADGKLVVKNNNLRARNSKINLFIPAARLQRGDYMVRLSALNAQNENESIADYTFRINRK